MTDLRPEEIEDAKDALRAAIVTYFDRIDPGSYVHSWVRDRDRHEESTVHMTGLPTEPGSVIGWHHNGIPGTAVYEATGYWTENGWAKPHTSPQLERRLLGINWWYMGCLTHTGITTTR